MTMSRKPVRGGEVHVRAIERLPMAVEDLERSSAESDAAQRRFDAQAAEMALAAASEQLTAREAWVKYIEHAS